MTDSDRDREQFEYLREEARTALDQHVEQIRATDQKALRILRSILVFFSIGIASLSILAKLNDGSGVAQAIKTFAHPTTLLAVVCLFVASLLAGITFTASQIRVGVEPAELKGLSSATGEKFQSESISNYNRWLELTKKSRIANDFYISVTVLFVLLAILFIAAFALSLLFDDASILPGAGIASVVVLLWYGLRIRQVIKEWAAWHHPVSVERVITTRRLLSSLWTLLQFALSNHRTEKQRNENNTKAEERSVTARAYKNILLSTGLDALENPITQTEVEFFEYISQNPEIIEEGFGIEESHPIIDGRLRPDLLGKDNQGVQTIIEIKSNVTPASVVQLQRYVERAHLVWSDEQIRGILVAPYVPETVKDQLQKRGLEYVELTGGNKEFEDDEH